MLTGVGDKKVNKGSRVKSGSQGGADRVDGGAELRADSELQRCEEQQSIWISWTR